MTRLLTLALLYATLGLFTSPATAEGLSDEVRAQAQLALGALLA